MKTINKGKCANCGSTDFLLAEDTTQYTPISFKGGVPKRGATSKVGPAESSDEAVRLFCNACGEYHTVPEELT